ncbi:class F sortase [Nonomuraea typhae]|uniref:class F sortase n=1 Tax=Nonomuraea typhae TaxID=2603600 RepID=UPI0012F79083|nr:class F sortase [Nonomuraea typhae]
MPAGRAARVLAAIAVGAAVAIAVDGLANRGFAPPPRPGAQGTLSRYGPAAPMPPSEPVTLGIAAIGVHAEVVGVGKAPDGTAEVPPVDRPELIGWYAPGPTPGERGAAVVFGHVDSRTSGPAVFYRLGALQAGDEIVVGRRDGSAAVFAVESVEEFAKDAFPTQAVYGPTGEPELRLVTCGGRYDPALGYLDNVIAFARLIPG